MSVAEPEDGSRGNGLAAERFTELLDVESRLTSRLLEVLAGTGVAAFARPRPEGGADRLHVDGEQVEAARLVVERELRADAASTGVEPSTAPASPQPWRSSAGQADVDAAWADIVAGFGRSGDEPVARWPASEDLPEESAGGRGGSTPGAGATSPRAEDPRPDLPDPAVPRAPRPDPEDTYRAPPPPPVGRFSRQAKAGVAAMVVGLLVLVFPGLLGFLGIRASSAVFAVGALAVVGGAVALFLRVSDGPRHSDGPDDGAVV